MATSEIETLNNLPGGTDAEREYAGKLRAGLRMCERAGKDGGLRDFFEGACALKTDDMRGITERDVLERKAWTGICAMNMMSELPALQARLAALTEATTAAQVGGFIDHLFPLLRAAFTNNPIMDLVSVQPMTRSVGLIFWLEYIYGQTKGQYKKGQTAFGVYDGYQGGQDYSSERVKDEQVGVTSTTASTALQLQLSYTPLRNGTVNITINDAVPYVIRDDGNGGLVKVSGGAVNIVAGSSSVSYQTGAVVITGSATWPTGVEVTASYEYDSEISGAAGQIDVKVSQSAIQAFARMLRARMSNDAMFDMQREFGEDLQPTVLEGIASLLRAEMAREVVSDLWRTAGAPIADFAESAWQVNGGYTKLAHHRDIMYTIEQASEDIFLATDRYTANWLICDVNAATLLSSLPDGMFEAAPQSSDQAGVQFVGVLNKKYRVWKDRLLAKEDGAVKGGNILMGYKGRNWLDAGYVHAPYQPVMPTPPVTLDDNMTRQAFRTRYAKKVVNPRLYRRITIS